MGRNLKIILFFLISFASVSCDRVTKDLAKEHLMNKEGLSYFHDTFRLEYVENTGAAMSMGDGLPQPYNFILLSLMPLIFLGILAVYTVRGSHKMSLPKTISLSLIFAGGLGNVIDRILFDRHVTDFMNFGVQNIRTGIFNFADVFVTLGVIGIMFFYKDKVQSDRQDVGLPA